MNEEGRAVNARIEGPTPQRIANLSRVAGRAGPATTDEARPDALGTQLADPFQERHARKRTGLPG